MEIGCKLGLIKYVDDKTLSEIILNCSKEKGDDMWIMENISELTFPQLSILVNGEYACLHYFQKEGLFFQSFGKTEIENIEFLIDNEPWEAPDYSIISIEKAIKCAQEFIQLPSNLPKTISWNEL